MAEPTTPIDDGVFERSSPKLSLAVEQPDRVVQFGFWPGSAARVHRAMNARFKLAKTLAPGRFATRGNALCIRTAFDTYLVVNADRQAQEDRLAPNICAVTDLSHARAAIAITGPAATPFLNRELAVDFSPEACPDGSAVQTTMHHMPVLLLRHAPDRFVLYVYRSYARDLAGWLADMALPFQTG